MTIDDDTLYQFQNGFDNEGRFVQAIRKHLLTDDQKRFLHQADLSIEDCLNGRYGEKHEQAIARKLYKPWNTKIGSKCFNDCAA